MRHFLYAFAMVILIKGEIIQRYLFCTEIEWDYAPGGHDVVALHGSVASDYIAQTASRIGSRYLKATYAEYADAWYRDELEKDASAPVGLLGPTIDAEVGDTLVVTVRSNLTDRRNCSFHLDTPFQKLSETVVGPGTTRTAWLVTPLTAPPRTASHPCTVWVYYSQTRGHVDFHSGLFGPLKICNRGSSRADPAGPVGLSAIMLFAVIDENHSWYLADNMKRYCTRGDCNTTDQGFIKSNRMYAINGFTYGHLPHLPIPSGVLIRWHLLMSPTARHMLTVRLNGHRLSHDGHSVYSVTIYPRTCVTVTLRPKHVGRWLLSTTDSFVTRAGMSALLQVVPNRRQPLAASRCTGIRRYYIAAHDVTNSDGDVIGAKFVSYDDITFSKVSRNTNVFAEIGEVIKVVFRNMASRNYSLQAAGLSCDKYSEGLSYNDTHGEPGGSHAVMPGWTNTYYWQADLWSAPGLRDPQCISASFTTDVVAERMTAVGVVVLCRRQAPRNRTVIVNTDKKQLWLRIASDIRYNNERNETDEKDFCTGDVITLYVTSEKTNGDPDLVWVSGHRLLSVEGWRNAMVVSPRVSLSASLVLRTPGELEVRTTSGTGDTSTLARVRVSFCPPNGNVTPTSSLTNASILNEYASSKVLSSVTTSLTTKRTEHGERVLVFLAAELIGWDYGNGRRVKKVYFARYTDNTFKRLHRTSEEPHVKLGLVGPTLRVYVGDRLAMSLKNRVDASRFNIAILKRKPAKIDASSDITDPTNGVPAQGVFVYSWYIDSSYANSDLPCTTHAYVSDVNRTGDVNAGLIGHLIVCKSRTNMAANKQSVAVVMADFHESRSTLTTHNILPTKSRVISSINGYVGDISGLLFPGNSTVTWYIVSASARLKWLTFAGSTLTSDCPVSPTSFVLPLFPYQTLTVITRVPTRGEWAIDCGKQHDTCWSIQCMSYVLPSFSHAS